MVDRTVAALFGDMWTSGHTQTDCAVCPSTWSRPADRPRRLAMWGPG